MALTPKKKDDFTLRSKDVREHGQNVVFIKGGSTVIGAKWVFFPDIRIDVKAAILGYVQSSGSRRIFNNVNDYLYVLFALASNGAIEVIPSVSFNKKTYGDIKVFPNISEKLPLILVKLSQDGSIDLSAMLPVVDSDIEIYQGYGNFTLKGPQGETGIIGVTGVNSYTGIHGITGCEGLTGSKGFTGIDGYTVKGETGLKGRDATPIPALILDRNLF